MVTLEKSLILNASMTPFPLLFSTSKAKTSILMSLVTFLFNAFTVLFMKNHAFSFSIAHGLGTACQVGEGLFYCSLS